MVEQALAALAMALAWLIWAGATIAVAYTLLYRLIRNGNLDGTVPLFGALLALLCIGASVQ